MKIEESVIYSYNIKFRHIDKFACEFIKILEFQNKCYDFSSMYFTLRDFDFRWIFIQKKRKQMIIPTQRGNEYDEFQYSSLTPLKSMHFICDGLVMALPMG